jgi:Tfp pilus assembly protein PilP
MKRTLTFSLLLTMAALAGAQTPTVAVKPGSDQKSATDRQVVSATAKASPTPVKVVPVSGQKSSPVVAKPMAVPAQPTTPQPVSVSAANLSTQTSVASAKSAPAKAGTVLVQPIAKPVSAGRTEVKADAAAAGAKDPFSGHKKIQAVQVKTAAVAEAKPAAESAKRSEAAPVVSRKIGAAGRRDPFLSPVVMSMSAVGSGCSSGKRCLNIEQIALRGVVRSDTGMIAVVVNALDKTYFLRENDPVFNGFVERITADSIVFKQTFRDKLGKPLTRDVTKTISRPAV